MSKIISGNQELNKKILNGVNTLADVVASTLGPRGRNVIIKSKNLKPIITKDGVSCAREISLSDPVENAAAQVIKQAAEETNTSSGDGPQPLYAKVLTPNGWVKMGELKVGDVICGTNGSLQNVLGIFPKGEKEVFEIETSDGRVVECCSDHLWSVRTHYGKRKTITTKEMFESGIFDYQPDGNKKYKYYIPTTSVELAHKEGSEADSYLFSSIKERKSLLQSLVNTNGFINKRGLFEFSTTNEQLYLDFITLCRSLGIQINSAKVYRNYNPKNLYNKPIYRVSQTKGYKYGLRIKEIRKTNRMTEMQCIKVSNDDHLYITNDFVPTHNTTTSTVLARAILQKSQAALAAGYCPVEIKREIEQAVEEITVHLKEMSRPISNMEDIERIATVSANGDKGIGKIIALAVDKVGKDGSISLQEAHSSETSLDVYEGFRFDSGLLANALMTDERRQCMRYEKCLVMVTDFKIDSIEELMPSLEIASRDNSPFIIIAEHIEGQALGAIIWNKMNGSMKVSAIKAPRYGEERRQILEDLAITIGATFITQQSGLSLRNVTMADFGRARIVESNKFMTTIVAEDNPAAEELVRERIEILKEQLADMEIGPEAERLQERITRLSSGVAVIKVGAPTHADMVEKKHRIEDAMEAVNAAQLEGVLPGGGTALIRAVEKVKSKGIAKTGASIVFQACEAPFRTMCKNAGLSDDVYINKLKDAINNNEDQYVGIDITSGEVVDMIEVGIIDPLKVTRNALKNAASAASTLLTTNFAIIDADE